MSEKNGSGGKRLLRLRDGRLRAGVCAGIAAYFGIDVNLVRLAFGLLTVFYGLGILIYLIAWVMLGGGVIFQFQHITDIAIDDASAQCEIGAALSFQLLWGLLVFARKQRITNDGGRGAKSENRIKPERIHGNRFKGREASTKITG